MGKTGPKNRKESEIFAIENLQFDIQYTVQKVMNKKGVIRTELAKKLNCSTSWVTQFLADDSNLTVDTIARVFHALGDECEIRSHFLEADEAAQVKLWTDTELFGTKIKGGPDERSPTPEQAWGQLDTIELATTKPSKKEMRGFRVIAEYLDTIAKPAAEPINENARTGHVDKERVA